MNTTPTQPGRDDHEELARLLPPPVERELPSGRHREVQEFVMAQIHEDLRSAERAPRRTRRRRPVVIGAALTAVAGATAAAVVIGTTGGSGGSVGSGGAQAHGSPGHSAGSLSGRQVLLAAASTAERAPAGSGTYWHVKIAYTKSSGSETGTSVIETWTRRDGRSWVRSGAPNSPVQVNNGKSGSWNDGFTVGSTHLSYQQVQRLPADPAALKKWITHHSDLMKAVGAPHGTSLTVSQVISGGLTGLLAMTPAPPAVRAAAFRALASLPEVRNLGRVDGGQGLLITDHDGTSRLVLDPATSRIRSSTYTGKGEKVTGGERVDAAEWTDVAPR